MASFPVSIRHATSVDVLALTEFRERMLVEIGADEPPRLELLRKQSVEWLADALAEGSAAGYLAERDGLLIGGVTMSYLRTQPQYRAPQGRFANIFGLYVLPAERGRGVATELVRRCVRLARVEGIELVTLHAADRARPIYERLGFDATNEMRLLLGE